MLIRFPDWQERLQHFFDNRRKQPMCWGTNDCALFTCDAILVETGVDLARWFRGKYSCGFSAIGTIHRFIKYGDIEDVAEAMAKEFAIPRWDNVLQARRGDVVLARTIIGTKLAVVWDGYVYSPGRLKLDKVRLDTCCRAWRI